MIVAGVLATCRWRPWLVGGLAAYVLVLGGLTVSRNRLWNDELALWQDAMAKGPALPRPAFAVGEVYRRRGDYVEAEACYRRSLAIQPDYRPALQNLGVVLEAQGRNQEALEVYGQFLRRWPDDVEVIHNVALLFNRLGQLDQARLAGRRVLELAPAHAGAILNLAQVEEQLGHRAEAIALCRRALAARPDARTALLAGALLGRALEQEGDLEGALAAYAGAQTVAPRDAALYLWRGGVLRQLRRFDEAQEMLNQALALGAAGVVGDAYLQLARLCRDRGDAAGAAVNYRRAREHGAAADPALEPAVPRP